MDSTYNYSQSRVAAPKQKCFQLNESITKIHAYVSGESTGVSVIALFLNKDGEGIACPSSTWCNCKNNRWVEASIPSGYSAIVLYRYGGSNPMKVYFS